MRWRGPGHPAGAGVTRASVQVKRLRGAMSVSDATAVSTLPKRVRSVDEGCATSGAWRMWWARCSDPAKDRVSSSDDPIVCHCAVLAVGAATTGRPLRSRVPSVGSVPMMFLRCPACRRRDSPCREDRSHGRVGRSTWPSVEVVDQNDVQIVGVASVFCEPAFLPRENFQHSQSG